MRVFLAAAVLVSLIGASPADAATKTKQDRRNDVRVLSRSQPALKSIDILSVKATYGVSSGIPLARNRLYVTVRLRDVLPPGSAGQRINLSFARGSAYNATDTHFTCNVASQTACETNDFKASSNEVVFSVPVSDPPSQLRNLTVEAVRTDGATAAPRYSTDTATIASIRFR